MTIFLGKNELPESRTIYEATLSQNLEIPSFKKQLDSIYEIIGTDIFNHMLKLDLIYLKLPLAHFSKYYTLYYMIHSFNMHAVSMIKFIQLGFENKKWGNVLIIQNNFKPDWLKLGEYLSNINVKLFFKFFQ